MEKIQKPIIKPSELTVDTIGSVCGVAALVEAFLSGRNEKTLRAYNNDLKDFAAFSMVGDVTKAAAALLSNGHGAANFLALQYRSHLVGRGLAPATINRRLASLRSLVKMSKTMGLIPWSLEVQGLRGESYRDTRGPGRIGVKALFSSLEGEVSPKAIRDLAIIHLLYDCGLRRGEVVGLDLEDLRLGSKRLFIVGKGKAEKVPVSLPSPTLTALSAWLKVHPEQSGPLFVNFDRAKKGGRLSGTSVYRMVRKYGVQLGINVRPHGLRHTAITNALEVTGGDVRRVARFSRHKDIRVLTHYDDNREDLGGEVASLVAGMI